MLAVAGVGEGAYGVPIWEAVQRATGRSIAMGAIYTTLDRLEEKGYVRSWQGEPTAQRGGRAKRFFVLTGVGEQALRDAENARQTLRAAGPQTAGGGI